MLVSILIPCFNARQWIAQAIESALAQSWPHKEVIVVDDGSTDGSDAVIRTFDGRITWQRQSNQGSNPTRNRLLSLAAGEWLQYLDADDYLLPGKIQGQMASIEGDSAVDVLFGPVTLEHVGVTGAQRELLPIPEPRDPWVLLARWYLPQTGAPLWRKAAIHDVGGWSAEQPACQEHELYLRLLMGGRKFVYTEANGAVYRQWSENTLWKKDQARTRRLRLEIEDRMEEFLRARGGLTEERHWAINMARFEMARMAWRHDREEAMAIVRSIERSGGRFVPAGAAAPATYQLIYRLRGFAAAESAAGWRRKLRGAAGGR